MTSRRLTPAQHQAQEIATLRAQLASVTVERDEARLDARARIGAALAIIGGTAEGRLTDRVHGLLSEVATLRAQLAAVTDERDEARSSVDSWVYCHESWQQQMSASDLTARHLLAHQHARRLEEREALESVLGAYLHEASQGDGIDEDHLPAVERAMAVIARGRSEMEQAFDAAMRDARARAALGGGR